jgi:superfamily II DNA or RNA helicase
MKSFDVFVFTEKKLYDILKHGFVKIEEFDLIVFDECHHADQSHYYNLIMQDFFFYNYTPGCRRPKILGLTASPIKDKVRDCTQSNIETDIKLKLQNLANNLYSKFVSLTKDQIKEIEKQSTEVYIEQYPFSMNDKVANVLEIK